MVEKTSFLSPFLVDLSTLSNRMHDAMKPNNLQLFPISIELQTKQTAVTITSRDFLAKTDNSKLTKAIKT